MHVASTRRTLYVARCTSHATRCAGEDFRMLYVVVYCMLHVARYAGEDFRMSVEFSIELAMRKRKREVSPVPVQRWEG